ncbi:MAG: glycosyltransferase family 4 protein, partial [Candidatus Heimdallarchaeota archaeon]|nr:glycosyltransferase family 4 protein [Candidatus Heimdallarchaeota archaeon]
GSKHNIWYVPNCVDVDRFNHTSISTDHKLKIGFVGRLEKSRGTSYLFDVIKNLPPNVEMYVLGAGNKMAIERFEGKIDTSKIHFEKNIPYEEMHKFYRKIDILFNPAGGSDPSGSYGISRASLESMSSGRPVIMLGEKERYPIIHGKTGYLVKPELKEILALLGHINDSRDELEEIAINGRIIIEKEFSNKVIIPKIEKIYEDILASGA